MNNTGKVELLFQLKKFDFLVGLFFFFVYRELRKWDRGVNIEYNMCRSSSNQHTS